MNDRKRASVHCPLQRGFSIFLTNESTRFDAFGRCWLRDHHGRLPSDVVPLGIPPVCVGLDKLLHRVKKAVVLLKCVAKFRGLEDDYLVGHEKNFFTASALLGPVDEYLK